MLAVFFSILGYQLRRHQKTQKTYQRTSFQLLVVSRTKCVEAIVSAVRVL